MGTSAVAPADSEDRIGRRSRPEEKIAGSESDRGAAALERITYAEM